LREVVVWTDVKKAEEIAGDVAGIHPIKADCGRQNQQALPKFQQSHSPKRLPPGAVLCRTWDRLHV
jgi:hypothetical protein